MSEVLSACCDIETKSIMWAQNGDKVTVFPAWKWAGINRKIAGTPKPQLTF